MHHSSYRDPLDGPPPKWKPHRPAPPQVQNNAWSWGHTGIKPPSDKVIEQTSPQLPSKTPPHAPISAVVKEKVTEQISPQSLMSSTQGTSNVRREDITTNERYIANKILTDCSDMDGLIAVCADFSGKKFQVLIAPFIERFKQITVNETINPEHVLFSLRRTLRITIPKK